MRISLYGSLNVSKLDFPADEAVFIGMWNSPLFAVRASADSNMEFSCPVMVRSPVAETLP